MRGFIVANLGKENIVARTQAVIRELGKCSVEAVMEESVKGLFQGEKVAFLPKEECLSTSDLILSIGGDGTILHIAQDAVRYDLPVLGINAAAPTHGSWISKYYVKINHFTRFGAMA